MRIGYSQAGVVYLVLALLTLDPDSTHAHLTML
jgi:hypothetical protein